MSNKIIKFPGVQQPVLKPETDPEFELNLPDSYCEITLEDIPDVDEMDYQYEDNQNFISTDKCYKCGKEIDYMKVNSEQMWNIYDQAGYNSQLEGSHVNIKICDTCLVFFLGRDLPQK